MSRIKVDPYLFDKNEKIVSKLLYDMDTPLKISRISGIPRATVYLTLNKLKARGLARKVKVGKKVKWQLVNKLAGLKRRTDSDLINIYEGKREMVLFMESFVNDKKTRFQALNGDLNPEWWKQNIGAQKVKEFNKIIGNHKIVSDIISSHSFIRKNINELGTDWIDDFKNKPTEYHLLEEAYTNFVPQIIIKGGSVLLIDMSKPLVIEINDTDISKCFESIFSFIKDHSRRFWLGDVSNNNDDKKPHT
jgi:hypothetical protein